MAPGSGRIWCSARTEDDYRDHTVGLLLVFRELKRALGLSGERRSRSSPLTSPAITATVSLPPGT
jgi:hypothetical protein